VQHEPKLAEQVKLVKFKLIPRRPLPVLLSPDGRMAEPTGPPDVSPPLLLRPPAAYRCLSVSNVCLQRSRTAHEFHLCDNRKIEQRLRRDSMLEGEVGSIPPVLTDPSCLQSGRTHRGVPGAHEINGNKVKVPQTFLALPNRGSHSRG